MLTRQTLNNNVGKDSPILYNTQRREFYDHRTFSPGCELWGEQQALSSHFKLLIINFLYGRTTKVIITTISFVVQTLSLLVTKCSKYNNFAPILSSALKHPISKIIILT